MLRAIVHLDADAFFASVEQAADPRLRGQPVAVGGEKRGIIASASYEARRYGIYTPMPTVKARRLCPKLILLPGDFEKYEQFSRWMFSYAYDFTPDVEIGSIDEGYFDLSGTRRPAIEIAETIRHAIRQSLKIAVSEGIGANKLVSQIASKLYKPASFHQVLPGGEASFLHPLTNQWLPGIGPKTSQKLNAAGLAFVGQIAATPVEALALLVGGAAPTLRHFANGIDERPVVPVSTPAKSYGHQETFAEDLTDEPRAEAVLRRMADDLMAQVRQENRSIRTLTVKVRYNDMAEEQCGESLPEPTDLETDLYGRIHTLLRKAWSRRVSLRMVSLRFSNVYETCFVAELPLEARARQQQARRRLATAVDTLRTTYGRQALRRGHDFLLDRPQTRSSKPASQEPSYGSADSLPHVRDRIAGCQPASERKRAGVGQGERSASWQPAKESRMRGGKPALQSMDGRPVRKEQAALRGRSSAVTPLHVHSVYSFLDSALSIADLIRLAQQHDLPAMALTDEGNLHGAAEFAQAAREAGIRPIIGAEIRWGGRPLRLYVENARGYRHLCQILSETAGLQTAVVSAEDELRRVRERFSTEGLLAASPWPGFASFFPGRFYLEISSGRRPPPAPAELPRIASWPVHYAAIEDRLLFDVIQSIRTRTLLRQAHPAKRLAGAYHFPSPAELRQRFDPLLLERSCEIAERCAFDFPFGPPQFPAFHPPDGSTPQAFLRKLVLQGLQKRYPTQWKPRQPQVEEELTIIHEVGYEEYFLVVWDLLQDCRRRGIDWLTRGSAADSLVCYCLEISSVCPIRFDLYFRRFLNRERMKMNKLPDIDVDFPHDRKDDVIDLLLAKYGREHTAVVGGLSTYQARSAVADVAKVLGVSEFQIRRFTEHLPHARAGMISEAIAGRMECRDLPILEDPYATAIRLAERLDGFPRHPKMHPCGVVLSRQPMMELTPCFISNKGYPTTHLDMEAVEAIGLVKMDILAQGGLAVMRDVKEALARRGISIDLNGLEPWQDPQVWDLIASGGARAVHHIESPAMIGLSSRCRVRDIDGLVAIVSVIRPGAANENKKSDFVRRYQGLAPVYYAHPSLEPCLKSTFGLVAYEEHILQICEAFAGLSAGPADQLRRALNKQKNDVIERIKPEFYACARARGHAPSVIEEVWNLVCGFKGYAFCKAHSTAYGVEAYQAAWLKRNYPAEFMAAVLSNGKGFYPPLVYILECHRLGIGLLPPSVNEPGPAYAAHFLNPTSLGSAGFLPHVRDCVAGFPAGSASETDGVLDSSHALQVRKPATQQAGKPALLPPEQPSPPTWDAPCDPKPDAMFPPLLPPWEERGKASAPPGNSGAPGALNIQRNPSPAPPLSLPSLDKSSPSSFVLRRSSFTTPPRWSIRVPLTRIKGLSEATTEQLLKERARAPFQSLNDFYQRVQPSHEEMESLIRAGAFDEFGQSRTRQYWEFQYLAHTFGHGADPNQGWLLPPLAPGRLSEAPLQEPTRLERLRWEAELFDFPVSGHPLELYPKVDWDSYCAVKDLRHHSGETVVTCGLVIEQRLHHQVTGEPMKFLTLADWTGIVETELFASTYKSYGLATIRYPILEVTATVEPFENGRGFSLRVHRAGAPREKR